MKPLSFKSGSRRGPYIHSLALNTAENGYSSKFNFILSNGTRSAQRDDWSPTKSTFMIPADSLHKIRSVTIHHNGDRISGFKFFDKDRLLLRKIAGTSHSDDGKETVLLEENEVIVGVVAKLAPGCQSIYTDF